VPEELIARRVLFDGIDKVNSVHQVYVGDAINRLLEPTGKGLRVCDCVELSYLLTKTVTRKGNLLDGTKGEEIGARDVEARLTGDDCLSHRKSRIPPAHFLPFSLQ